MARDKSDIAWTRDFLKEALSKAQEFPHVFQEQARLLEMLPGLVQELDKPPVLAVVGLFKSGKSSTINALLGADIAPTDPRPATAKVTRFRQGMDRVRFYREDGWVDGTIESFRRFVDQNARVQDSREADAIKYVEVQHPSPLLRDLELIDTPGFGSEFEAHDREAETVLAEASAVAWVIDLRTPLSGKDLERIQRFAVPGQPRFSILNFADEVPPSDRVRIVEDFKRRYASLFWNVFLFSARVRRDANGGASIKPAQSQHLTLDLERVILDRVRSRAAELRVEQVLGNALGAIDVVLATSRSREKDLSLFRGQVESACTGLRESARRRAASMNSNVGTVVTRECKNLFKRRAPKLAKIVKVDEGFFSDDLSIRHEALLDWVNRSLQDLVDVRQNIASVVEPVFAESFGEMETALGPIFDAAPDDLSEWVSLAGLMGKQSLEARQILMLSRTADATVAFLQGALTTFHNYITTNGHDEGFLGAIGKSAPGELVDFLDTMIADEDLCCWIDQDLKQCEPGADSFSTHAASAGIEPLEEIVVPETNEALSRWSGYTQVLQQLFERGQQRRSTISGRLVQ